MPTDIKRRTAPLARAIAPRWYWQRKYRILQEIAATKPELQLVTSLCDPSRISVDVGAAVGEFCVAMLRSSRSVIAFEPRPAQARALKAMFDAVGVRADVKAMALSDHPGTTAMRVVESDPGRSTIEASNTLADAQHSPVATIDVPVLQLDDLHLRDVGFVKIDVEGHELAVLHGAAETLRRNRPALLIEAEERHHPNAVAEITRWLGGLNYTGHFDIKGTLRPIDEFDPETHQSPANVGGWEDNWMIRGVYVNTFVFLPEQ
nr:FkbM family methyltransferase [Mycolicibacter acidiphilus]